MQTIQPMSPAIAAILSGTYKASCDIVELNKRVPTLTLLLTPTGMQSFECAELGGDAESIWQLRNLAAHLQARSVVLVTQGHKPGDRVQVAVFYAEVAGASWIAHAAVQPRMEDEPAPTILHPVFHDGSKSSFYPLLTANGRPGVPVIPTDAG